MKEILNLQCINDWAKKVNVHLGFRRVIKAFQTEADLEVASDGDEVYDLNKIRLVRAEDITRDMTRDISLANIRSMDHTKETRKVAVNKRSGLTK